MGVRVSPWAPIKKPALPVFLLAPRLSKGPWAFCAIAPDDRFRPEADKTAHLPDLHQAKRTRHSSLQTLVDRDIKGLGRFQDGRRVILHRLCFALPSATVRLTQENVHLMGNLVARMKDRL